MGPDLLAVLGAGGGSVGSWAAAAAIGLASAALWMLLVLGLTLARERERRGTGTAGVAPSPAWRLVRLATGLLEPLVEPLLPVPVRHHLATALRRAGLDLVLGPEAFAAGQCLCALAGASLGGLAVHAFSWPGLSVGICAALGYLVPGDRLAARARQRAQAVARDLPATLDLLALSVDAGSSLPAALAIAAERGPRGALRDEIARLLRETHAGRARQEALSALAERLPDPGVRHMVAAIRSADRRGGDLAALLRDQAEQRRQERFIDAERRAMQAPVRLLLPLLVFIFPGTFLILLFPIVIQLLETGLFR